MIANIRLQNYRSYIDESFEFEPGVNIIIGPNASGKTNLLEALYVVCVGKTFRGKDENLIMDNKPWARLDAYLNKGNTTLKIVRGEQTIQKTFEVQNTKTIKLSKKHQQPVVVFEPNHLLLMHGSPDLRRDYLDNVSSIQNSDHQKNVRAYQRTLAQRNTLLKNIRTPEQLFVWDIRLSELGEKIVRNRLNYLESTNKKLPKIYSSLAGTENKLSLLYKSKCDTTQYGSSMLKLLERNHEFDIDRGFTSIGPHRDDFDVILKDKIASVTASRGETRTIMIALKIIELELSEKSQDSKPVFMLDDVFSELDGKRRQALTNYMQNYQTFITTTDADVLLHNFSQKTKQIIIQPN